MSELSEDNEKKEIREMIEMITRDLDTMSTQDISELHTILAVFLNPGKKQKIDRELLDYLFRGWFLTTNLTQDKEGGWSLTTNLIRDKEGIEDGNNDTPGEN